MIDEMDPSGYNAAARLYGRGVAAFHISEEQIATYPGRSLAAVTRG